MVLPRWITDQIGLHEAAALRPWMLVPKSLAALAAEVRLTYIDVSKTNDHSRELTVPVQKTELVQTKVKRVGYIYFEKQRQQKQQKVSLCVQAQTYNTSNIQQQIQNLFNL
ncbi:Hypothetical_protein [Hexamita inflata]|uniref:Hypothetical_protein n=1 Tax=Hexamita inflata TaxID=28002 RepID=A0AA86QFM4_9EUKA|nr:Hypothetical protein HINF_LOCUS43032 [Hexamita inflata]